MTKLKAILAAGLLTLSVATAQAGSMAALTSAETQVATGAHAPFAIRMRGDATDSFRVDGSRLLIQRDGLFSINAAAQVGGKGDATGEIYTWMRVNGKDVAESTSRQTIPVAGFTTVLVTQAGITLRKDDVVEFMVAASAPSLGIVAFQPTAMPVVPSIILSIVGL